MKIPTVLLGVTGGIAAYKSCEIVRALQKAGADVHVVMTEAACNFVSPLTFRALSQHDVSVDLFEDADDPVKHITLAKMADLFLIAPCTANVIAKLSVGIADDLLTSIALATTAPILLAPAMNVNMYENIHTQRNIGSLKEAGVHFVEPDNGYLACGDSGKGKLAAVDKIASHALGLLKGEVRHFSGKEECEGGLEGKRVLVTAGPTVEYIDPVRFLSNPSSGKMGFAIAEEAKRRGADVTLIAGPVDLSDIPGVKTVRVTSAEEMLDAARKVFPKCDIAVFSAAVSDMRPKRRFAEKLKKGKDDDALSVIELERNPDILGTLGREARADQVIIGFAAETENIVDNAKRKLKGKCADMVVANDVSNQNAFGKDSEKAYIVTEDDVVELPMLAKSKLANAIFEHIV